MQGRFTSGECALIEQDLFRRAVLREKDVVGALNIDLMEHAASTCLEQGLVVIVEGILTAARNESMLQRLSLKMTRASFYCTYDVVLAEASRRHVFGSSPVGPTTES